MRKTIVVSGASKGIGYAIAERFLAEGFDAIICARNLAELSKVQNEFFKKYPNQKIEIFAADLSKKAEVDKFVDFIAKNSSQVDVLVNNTGIFAPGQIHNEADGQLEHMIETNLYSAYYLSRGLLGPMMSLKKGHIFNICSIASIVAYPNGGSYSISKFALYGMSKAMREELKPHGIRVTAVLPGATRTASWDGVADTLAPDRLMNAADVATMIWACHSLSANADVEELVIRPQLGDL